MNCLSLKKNNKFFWLYIILGVLCIFSCILFMPVWDGLDWAFWSDWGSVVLNLVLAVFLILYLSLYLIRKIKKVTNTTLKILFVVEFTIVSLIALYLILGHWIPELNIIPVNGCCATIGLTLWIQGVIGVFSAYFYQRNMKQPYPIVWLCISIILVSLGISMLVKPFISDIALLWIVCCGFFISGISFLIYGIYSQPRKTN